jgi:hypothetical protein
MFPEREGDTVEVEGKMYRFEKAPSDECEGCDMVEGVTCKVPFMPCFSEDGQKDYILKEVDNNGSN